MWIEQVKHLGLGNPMDNLWHVSGCIWEAVKNLGLSIKYVIAWTPAESGIHKPNVYPRCQGCQQN
jgi:hypothetical protein